jgi:uncharacterized membrane protein (UPF0127 family)
MMIKSGTSVILLTTLIACVFFAACSKNTTQSQEQPRQRETTVHLDHAQPKLPQIKLWLKDKEILAEVATTPEQLMTGMMFRKEIGENEGMLFVFQYPHRASFYMKNTYVPLSIAYINPEGVIMEIYDLEPLNEKSVTATNDNIQFALEVKQGWFKKNNITPGTVIKTPRGSLLQTFFNK